MRLEQEIHWLFFLPALPIRQELSQRCKLIGVDVVQGNILAEDACSSGGQSLGQRFHFIWS